ncbi:hypothetical protein ACJX0J_022398, partial [Zea mays]
MQKMKRKHVPSIAITDIINCATINIVYVICLVIYIMRKEQWIINEYTTSIDDMAKTQAKRIHLLMTTQFQIAYYSSFAKDPIENNALAQILHDEEEDYDNGNATNGITNKGFNEICALAHRDTNVDGRILGVSRENEKPIWRILLHHYKPIGIEYLVAHKITTLVLNESKLRYFHIIKMAYALLTSCKLVHYFHAHQIEVHTSSTLVELQIYCQEFRKLKGKFDADALTRVG